MYRFTRPVVTAALVVVLGLVTLGACGPCGVTVGTVRYPPFIKAAQRGDIATAERLLWSGEYVHQTTIGNQTALHVAAIEGQEEMVEWLLAHEADPLAMDDNGKTPADFARRGGYPGIEQLILRQVQLYRDENDAVAEGDVVTLKGLLADDSRRYDVLHVLAQAGAARAVSKELDGGADPNARTLLDITPLHKAVVGGRTGLAKLLLAAGADIDACDFHDQTPLFWAAASNDEDMVDLLLDAGADPGIRSVWGETPREIAARFGYPEIVAIIDEYR